MASGTDPADYDLTADGKLDTADLHFWLKTLKKSWSGDSDLDGEFNSGDLIQVFAAGKYEQDLEAGWEEGDWNGDRRFDSSDLVSSFQDGGYERGPLTGLPVPEPGYKHLLTIIGGALITARLNGRLPRTRTGPLRTT